MAFLLEVVTTATHAALDLRPTMDQNDAEDLARRTAILQLVDVGDYSGALETMETLSGTEKNHGRLIIAKADCLYELGNDVEALVEYIRYLEVFPDGRGRNFALVGAAMALKNLELENEAFELLKRVSPDHDEIEGELKHSVEILEKQKKALGLLYSKKLLQPLPIHP